MCFDCGIQRNGIKMCLPRTTMGLLNLLLLALAAVPSVLGAVVSTSAPRPLVMWHGMGVCIRRMQLALIEHVSRRLLCFTRNG